MATIDLGDRIWFQVPISPDKRVDVVVPHDLSAKEADHAADRIDRVIRAMFAVDASDLRRFEKDAS